MKKKIVLNLIFAVILLIQFTPSLVRSQDDERSISLTLSRVYEGDTCTVGFLYLGDSITGEEICQTFEPPWENNETDVSCIPPGEYKAFVRPRRGGIRIQLIDKPEVKRRAVQIHTGNDLTHTAGCILVGTKIDKEVGLVEGSQDAMIKLMEKIFGIARCPGQGDELLRINITLMVEGEKGKDY